MSNSIRETSRTKWRTLIEEQEKSGLSQRAFCEKNGLALPKFVYYRGRIKLTGTVSHPSSSLFSPVQLSKNAPNTSREIRIFLPNGFQCVFPCDVDAVHIKKYMEVLLSC